MENVASQESPYQARLSVVQMLLEAGRPLEALDRMKGLAASDPTNAEAYNDLAVVAYQTGQLAEARAAIARAAELGHHDPALAENIRDNLAAIDAALLAADPTIAYRTCAAVVERMLAIGETAVAADELERFLADHPTAAEAWHDLAVVQQVQERLEPAQIAAGIAVEIDPANAGYRRTRAAILLAAGRWEEAGPVIAPALTTHPDDVEALLLAGDISVAAARPADARPFYQRALDLDPACGQAALQLALLPFNDNDIDLGPADTLMLVVSHDGPAALDQTLRTFARHCQDKAAIDVKVLYRPTGPEQQRLYQSVAVEHPFATLVSETDLGRQLAALLGPHRHALLVADDTVFMRDFRLTDAAHALDSERRALSCSLTLGENTTTSRTQRKSQRVPSMTRFAHGLYRFAWLGAEHDFGRPLTTDGTLVRADELRRLLPKLTFHDLPSLDRALGAAVDRFAAPRPTMLCYDRAVASSRTAEAAAVGPSSSGARPTPPCPARLAV